MKITATSLNSPIAGTAAGSRTDAAAGSSVSVSAGTAGAKGTVDLSAAARHLSSLESSDNDINVERVNQIRDAIASGQLKIDPSRIADGLIASVRDLLK